MLLSLAIRDVVLIDRLDIAFRPGLCVLTGETGAGKSILLDSLGLALGARSESGLVRAGAERATVTATFEMPADHPAHALLAAHDLADAVAPGEPLMLRRQLGADGRSRAFLNDGAVSVGLLRSLGALLCEVQAQFEQHGLLDPATHRGLLDAHAGLGGQAAAVRDAWRAWRDAERAAAEAEEVAAKAATDEAYLRHAVEEIDKLAPRAGEETLLAEERQRRQQDEKLLEALHAAAEILSGGSNDRAGRGAASDRLSQAASQLHRIADRVGGRADPILAALDRAASELGEAERLLAGLVRAIDPDPKRLDAVEERLFALRALARKHQSTVDGLAALRDRMAAQLAAIDDSTGTRARLRKAAAETRKAYLVVAAALSSARTAAASALDKAVAAELAPLKLEKARFRTRIEPLPEDGWGEAGTDRVGFAVSTNPGAPEGPLDKIASGGELSRFLLALKVVTAQAAPIGTLVFDEVDSGIGGATADAVGARLARLAASVQVLVVTHSPQVAARGSQHLRVAKAVQAGQTRTVIETLDDEARREEVARMLAGAVVTAEARAAADRLLADGKAADQAPSKPARRAKG
ncbi:MAG: DNA repair protein RecN [Alphaproteobacteria bacterium]|nr:DNA repair protein RecN [Alphaproteobacteria bacterium]